MGGAPNVIFVFSLPEFGNDGQKRKTCLSLYTKCETTGPVQIHTYLPPFPRMIIVHHCGLAGTPNIRGFA